MTVITVVMYRTSSHAGRYKENGREIRKPSWTKKRIKWSPRSLRFENDGYNSSELPPSHGKRGKNMHGKYRMLRKNRRTSEVKSNQGDPVYLGGSSLLSRKLDVRTPRELALLKAMVNCRLLPKMMFWWSEIFHKPQVGRSMVRVCSFMLVSLAKSP